MESFVGKYVRTSKNYTGRVKAKHINFKSTNEDERWLACQIPPIPTEALNRPWYSIIVHQSGSFLVPENNIIESQDTPIDGVFENPWESFYFDTKQ